MQFSSNILSQTITQLCLAKGITQIVISPGSRNAPLIIGFTEDNSFETYSIVDERCAAFFALGMAQQTGKPVALVCTSGSALLNYYPAIAEAFYSDIPLVVLSADRPHNLIEIGDGQTINQENVFANHILYSANCIEGTSQEQHNETEINIALNTAIELQGPVHINLPFSEPLYDLVDDLHIRPQHVPARRIVAVSDTITSEIATLKELWNASGKTLILIGVQKPNTITTEIIQELARDSRVVMMTETTSNIHHPSAIHAIDQLIEPFSAENLISFQPELLITLGGMIVSKKVKALLRTHQPAHHYHIDPKKAYDTYFSLSGHIKASPQDVFERLLIQQQMSESNYRSSVLEIKKDRELKHAAYLAAAPFSDFKVYEQIFKKLPKEYQLQLSNSTAIRYSQLFKIESSIDVYCNRGTSGIDGSMSTAIGAAVQTEKPVLFITGDLSFFYDSNALWNNYIPANFKIIVVNNSGGGIFRILPKAKTVTHFESYFETRHHLTAEHLAKQYNCNYAKATDLDRLKQELGYLFNVSEAPTILEVFTPPEVNDLVLLDYFKKIQ
ncbi:2-succinyl-5-enolpyruvyl-6-hydroxy-3-cyclohexene-1-carboxylic-acid synthase [Patiriisocius sp. Uisw_047]|jgi:2-succinyl-5-enolpyruvyl-6-hydroxy-3-cyclohexene-1-carboxylate synthase|uniref:2-succinyl-5-enolpyruvyl-6-hydroxy-3- cyclohexene-1-carboxylic-acid synthase n=1 Tax=Patiriisocius sp. Uisw_047 TaxID=3230969 RepID=UPI0039E906FF